MIDAKSERKELIQHYLKKTFYNDWSDNWNSSLMIKEPNEYMYGSLELQLSNSCNLNCTYCYYHQNSFGPQLNPSNISKKDNLIKNAKKIFYFLEENKYCPSGIELFGGEIIFKSVTFDILDIIYDFLIKLKNNKPKVMIPSNLSFVMRPELVKKLEHYMYKFREIGSNICLSASIDGKYMDQHNRPSTSHRGDQSKFYTDERYEKIFDFADKHRIAFHPMVYYNNIEQWIENFDWFQDMFEKHNLPWQGIYLLEVRNDGWTPKAVNTYIKFVKHVANFILKKAGSKKAFFDEYFFKPRNNMNLFNNVGRIGRGLGCSLQTTMQLRLGDLTVVPCHRQSYDVLNGFKFVTDDKTIIDVHPENVDFYMSMVSTHRSTWPYCENCLINSLCPSGCPGSQFESMGDPFLPIPSVCLMFFGKIRAQLEFFEENDLMDDLTIRYAQSINQLNTYQKYNEMLKKEKLK